MTLPKNLQKDFKTVFAKATKELEEIGEWILSEALSFEEFQFSATEKAISLYTSIAFGFIRANSKSVEINLFLPLDQHLDSHWKESRHTTVKKLATRRIWDKKDLNANLRNLIATAYHLSQRPRSVDTSSKKGFLLAVEAIRQRRNSKT